jgi:hypothetical protein
MEHRDTSLLLLSRCVLAVLVKLPPLLLLLLPAGITGYQTHAMTY